MTSVLYWKEKSFFFPRSFWQRMMCMTNKSNKTCFNLMTSLVDPPPFSVTTLIKFPYSRKFHHYPQPPKLPNVTPSWLVSKLNLFCCPAKKLKKLVNFGVVYGKWTKWRLIIERKSFWLMWIGSQSGNKSFQQQIWI